MRRWRWGRAGMGVEQGARGRAARGARAACARRGAGGARRRAGAIARLEVAVGRGAEELHDLDQVLLGRVLALVRQVAEEELHQDRAHRPDVDADGVLGRAEHELGRAVVPRADVRHVGLPLHQHLRAPEVAQPALERRRVAEQVVRLDVAVADAPRVDVLERAERLPQVRADVVDGEALPPLVVLEGDRADRLGQEVHHEVEVDLVLLPPLLLEVVAQLHDVLVVHHLHHLQLAVVVPPVEQHLLDRHRLRLRRLRVAHDPEGARCPPPSRGGSEVISAVPDGALLGAVPLLTARAAQSKQKKARRNPRLRADYIEHEKRDGRGASSRRGRNGWSPWVHARLSPIAYDRSIERPRRRAPATATTHSRKLRDGHARISALARPKVVQWGLARAAVGLLIRGVDRDIVAESQKRNGRRLRRAASRVLPVQAQCASAIMNRCMLTRDAPPPCRCHRASQRHCARRLTSTCAACIGEQARRSGTRLPETPCSALRISAWR